MTSGGGSERHTDGRADRAMRWASRTALVIAVVAVAAGRSSVSHGAEGNPIGYVRSLNGPARIRAATGEERLAEPFCLLWVGDTIAVQNGVAVVSDMRTGESFEVQAGNSLALPPTVARPNRSLYKSLRAALRALTSAPKQTGVAVVRGEARRTWPDQVSFAPSAAIQFRWRAAAAATFDLRRVEAQPALVLHSDQPLSPLPWPGAVHRIPGRYVWEVRDSHGARLASGQFTVMTEAEAGAQRERFMTQTPTELDAQQRSLIAELLAAHDGYVLN